MIQDMLIAWGHGKAMNSAPNDYPNMTPFARLMAQGSVRLGSLGQDQHERIDRTVSAMKHSRPDSHKIIFCAYVNMLNDAQIARHMRFEGQRFSRSWVRQARKAAEAYLEAKLESPARI